MLELGLDAHYDTQIAHNRSQIAQENRWNAAWLGPLALCCVHTQWFEKNSQFCLYTHVHDTHESRTKQN